MNTGRLIQASNLDSVRIEVLGESRALTIPCEFILAIDRALRFTLAAEESLSVWDWEDDDGNIGWRADVGNVFGEGDTPWGAIVSLAEAIDREARRGHHMS